MNSGNNFKTDNDTSTDLTTEELTITILYYSIAFLIFVVCLIFINKRI